MSGIRFWQIVSAALRCDWARESHLLTAKRPVRSFGARALSAAQGPIATRREGSMGRLLAIALASALWLASLGLVPVETKAADGRKAVTTWVTVGSVRPAAGCVVDVSVEVRDGNGPASNLDIALGFVVDGEIVDVPRAVTGPDGIAHLSLDMSLTYPGAATRVEVNVAGTYADRVDLAPTDDGPCSGEPFLSSVTAEIWAPNEAVTNGTDDNNGETSAIESGQGTFLSVPTYVQQRNLSCEFASLSIATGALGNWVSEYALDELVGWSANPHWGFRGDINGLWGNTIDYGVYPEALAGPLGQLGFSTEVIYGGGDPGALTARLDAGMPTLVWLGLWGDTSFYESMPDGTTYKLASGYHVVVAYGYDDWGIYVSDPAIGDYRSYDWVTFIAMWNVLDGMALAIALP